MTLAKDQHQPAANQPTSKPNKFRKAGPKPWYRCELYGWSLSHRTLGERLSNLWRILRQPHYRAVLWPRPGAERALVEMMRGWARYADSCVADSGASSAKQAQTKQVDAWGQIGWGLDDLCRGPSGRLEGPWFRSLLERTLTLEGQHREDFEPKIYDDHFVGMDELEKQWAFRHFSVVAMVQGWCSYAEEQRALYGSSYGLGHYEPEWVQIGSALLVLVPGSVEPQETKSLIDLIRSTLQREGCDPDSVNPE